MAHLLVEVSPRLSQTDLACGTWRFFQPGCCRQTSHNHQVPYKGMGGPVEPATVAKVEAPLNGRVCGWDCLVSYDPALVPEAPIGLNEKGQRQNQRI